MSRPALLIMDVQRTVVSWIPGGEDYARRLTLVVEAARSASVPVIYVMVMHRDGHPEVRRGSHFFSHLLGTPTLTESDPNSTIHSAVAPHPGEPVLVKRFISSFYGADLDPLLRAQGINTLVLTGIGTSGVDLSTLRDGTERQFNMVVLSDGCADADDEVHRVLVEKVFPREAHVMTVDEWTSRIA